MALSVGLHTALSALLAQQRALDAVAHNVANVNTPGYTRQRVRLEPSAPAGSAGVGTGVNIVGIERIRDMFIDFQLRAESHAAGEFLARRDSLRLVELALGEPGSEGMSAMMDAFWNSWRDLANGPEQSAARSSVVQAGESLAFTMTRLHRSLTNVRNDANTRVESAVRELNDLATQVAALNQQIVGVRAKGDPASDLSDRRDLALDRIAQLVDARFMELEDGRVDVHLDGRSLVSGIRVNLLETVKDPANQDYLALRWQADGADVTVRSGEIGGLLHQRDVDLPARIAELDTLVAQIIQDVNAVHEAGYALDGVTTGIAFFTGTDASDIAVNADIAADLGLLAAAEDPNAVGDGANALSLADLQFATNLTGGSETYAAFYNGAVTRAGIATRDAENMRRSQQLTLDHLQQLRLSVSGVNLDEEMIQLVQFQRGYEAAARLIRVIDDVLDTLINRT